MRRFIRVGVPSMLVLTLLVTGCSSNSEEAAKEMDAPPINYVDENETIEFDLEEEVDASVDTEQEMISETVQRELYLIDSNGMVVPQTVDLPKTEGVIKQSLEYLVEGGPVSNMLPNGFKAVLPAGTLIDVNLTEDGLAIADFSEEFQNYNPEQELQILQAITWTLTQFESVESVKIRINGYDQETMPVNNTPIGEKLTRANGINLETDSIVDMSNSKGVTLYFLSQNGDNTYYVPVTRRVERSEDAIQTVVDQLLTGPSMHSNLLTDFSQGVQLLDSPQYENGVVTLNFNEALLNNLQGTAISNDVLNLLVLSLTEQEGVEQVAVQVNGDSKILQTSGEFLAEPVSRPTLVNTGKF
ncbi:GerMN domain-containing protein [Bacillus sp. FJAT-45350]|uniref:GerMN domain-containing protein n=1 Tax=Bacillus sp. FJAT-45350 TaxID=2011014 RepID=UPI000BB7043D|nr:GerMN domain-containing protein [Bacillus sp. FJAT-45350]